MFPVLISTVLGLSLIPSTISSVLASPNYNNVSQKISPTIKVQRSQLNKNRIFWSKIKTRRLKIESQILNFYGISFHFPVKWNLQKIALNGINKSGSVLFGWNNGRHRN